LALTDHSFSFYWSVFFGLIIARYFLLVGSIYILFYSVLGKKFNIETSKAISSPFNKSIRQDVELSLVSGLIFAFCAGVIMSSYDLGITLFYRDPLQYGLWYLIGSFWIVLVLQDTYFYFIHRLFHRPKLFKWFPRGHHRSVEPTPWTSFAFDPPEAVIQALFLVVIVFIIPLHYITFIAILMTMTLWSIVNHLGFQLFADSPGHNFLSRWLIGAKHHLIHHKQYNIHYGLYFTFWDKLLGTQDINYDK